jgi:hypothetical protein
MAPAADELIAVGGLGVPTMVAGFTAGTSCATLCVVAAIGVGVMDEVYEWTMDPAIPINVHDPSQEPGGEDPPLKSPPISGPPVAGSDIVFHNRVFAPSHLTHVPSKSGFDRIRKPSWSVF